MTERVVYLPEGEVLPYDLETTPPSIKAVRATALTRLMSGIENPILVISGPNLMQPVAAKSFWLGSQFELKIGSTLPDGHEKLLEAWGYTKSFRVKSPSTWSQRGKVLTSTRSVWLRNNPGLSTAPCACCWMMISALSRFIASTH